MTKPFPPGLFRRPPLAWLAAHGGLLLALGVSLFVGGPLRINTGLMDILPPSEGLRSAAAADAVLGERNSRQIVILAESAGFAGAKAGAEELYAALAGAPALAEPSPDFESLSLRVDAASMSRFSRYFYDYRFMLLDDKTVATLESGGADSVAANALAEIYGAFTMTALDNLDGDPFLLAGRPIKRLLAGPVLSGGNLSPRDEVLAAQFEGNWYVMIQGSLSPRGASLTNREGAVQQIYAAVARITEAAPGLRFYCSGVPFHSFESASGAQREISLISGISLAAVLLILFSVFRSPVPVLVSLAAIGCSIMSALGAALLVFREVHVLSFVFGTTLIGTCVDYSIHYFFHRQGLPALGGAEVRSRIFRGIAMSFISTVICFTALLCAPFVILRQFAVFSIAGLSSSFLSVMCIYPFVWNGPRRRPWRRPWQRPWRRKNTTPSPRRFPLRMRMGRTLCLSLLSGMSLLCLALLFVNRDRVRVENRLGDLYAMPEHLAESERINARTLNYGYSGWYFIVSGSDPDEVLKNEESLRYALDGEIARGNLGSYTALSVFIPSQQSQRRSYAAARKLLPLAETQFANLGFPPEAAEAYRLEFAAAAERYALPGADGFPAELAANLWLGEIGGEFYSCVLPMHAKDEAPFRAIAGEREGVFFVNKVRDTGAELDRLTTIMLALLLAAFIVIAVIARCRYSWGGTLRICSVPLLLTLAVLAALSCLNIPLGFFSMVGLLLVFGLGLDYMFYSIEAEQTGDGQGLTAPAICLSFITTALSFGALALSGFAPVHIFGVTVCTGLSAAYISATLVTAGFDSENQRS